MGQAMEHMWFALMAAMMAFTLSECAIKTSGNGPQVYIRSTPLTTRMRSDFIEVFVTPYTYVERERKASVRLVDQKNDIMGVLHFLQRVPPVGPVHITGNITGLTPGSHGIHVHTNGDCAQAGRHFNPFQQRHGLSDGPVRHVGDLGNIIASPDGIAVVDMVDTSVSLIGRRNIIGRSVVIDTVEDDGLEEQELFTPPTRSACGIIGIMES